MNKMTYTGMAAMTAALFMMSGCGSSGGEAHNEAPELESEGKTLIFYSASTNGQYAYDVDSETVTDLNGETDAEGEDITNFNMSASDKGRLFIWVDDKGDTDASNDEDKVVMFRSDYAFAEDGNATWEDFYYLGHFHSHTEDDNTTTYHLAAHANEEFDVTEGAKYNAMLRLNAYLQQQETLKSELAALLPAEANALCAFHRFENEEGETFYYTMGTNGTMYVYDAAYGFRDSVAVADSCEADGVGMSSAEDGVLIFLSGTQKAYLIDSHEDGIYHVHSSWALSELLGDGKSAQMMVGLQPLIGE